MTSSTSLVGTPQLLLAQEREIQQLLARFQAADRMDAACQPKPVVPKSFCSAARLCRMLAA